MPRFENIERVQSYDSPVKLCRSKFSVRDVRGRGWNNDGLRERERKREREAYLSRSEREGREGPAVSRGKRWRANVRDWWADCLSRKTERLVKWQLNTRSSLC